MTAIVVVFPDDFTAADMAPVLSSIPLSASLAGCHVHQVGHTYYVLRKWERVPGGDVSMEASDDDASS